MSKEISHNPKQTAFIAEYLKDFNGTQSAIRAGYSEKSANEKAAQLLAIVSIREEINRQINESLKEGRTQLKSKVQNELEQLSFSKLHNYIDELGDINIKAFVTDNPGAVKSFKTIETFDKQGNRTLRTEFQLHSKEKSLELLAKISGLVEDRGTPENPLHIHLDSQDSQL